MSIVFKADRVAGRGNRSGNIQKAAGYWGVLGGDDTIFSCLLLFPKPAGKTKKNRLSGRSRILMKMRRIGLLVSLEQSMIPRIPYSMPVEGLSS